MLEIWRVVSTSYSEVMGRWQGTAHLSIVYVSWVPCQSAVVLSLHWNIWRWSHAIANHRENAQKARFGRRKWGKSHPKMKIRVTNGTERKNTRWNNHDKQKGLPFDKSHKGNPLFSKYHYKTLKTLRGKTTTFHTVVISTQVFLHLNEANKMSSRHFPKSERP